MASGQTQYYGLSQWEAADQVLQTEFNADNQKIDGALKAMWCWISCAPTSTPCRPGGRSWRGSERAPRSKCSGGPSIALYKIVI